MNYLIRQHTLGSRLEKAMEFIGSCNCFADIGCDHGHLCCSLLINNLSDCCIASDISAPSLDKARTLAERLSLTDHISFRVGDGLNVLDEGEADCIAILGMGGTLIARILDAVDQPFAGASKAVFQPMRAQDDLRKYLYEHGYHIERDEVVLENGRLYQILAVLPPDGKPENLPAGFPEECYSVGYRAFENRDPLTKQYVFQELQQARKRLKTAAGTSGEAVLRKKESDMLQILMRWEEIL